VLTRDLLGVFGLLHRQPVCASVFLEDVHGAQVAASRGTVRRATPASVARYSSEEESSALASISKRSASAARLRSRRSPTSRSSRSTVGRSRAMSSLVTQSCAPARITAPTAFSPILLETTNGVS
jgi:hypothetical protein